VVEHPGEHVAQAVGGAGRDGRVDELALAAVALGRHHHPTGDGRRHGRPELAPHEVQAGVDARGGAGARDDVTRVDEEHVRVDVRLRVCRGELVRVHPVRGARAAVEEPGRAEDERAAADREDGRARGVGPPQGVEQGGGEVPQPRGGNGHEVGALEPLQAVRHGERQPVEQVDRALGVLGADPEVDGGHALGRAVEAENLVQEPELEGGHLLGHENSDRAEGHGEECDTSGRKTPNSDRSATRGAASTDARLLP
jgi:hypothetical protein